MDRTWTYISAYDCYFLERVPYCTVQEVPAQQCMNIYVPAAYLRADGSRNSEGVCRGYTAETAPIVFENGLAGYMEAEPFELEDPRSAGKDFLDAGFVYVSCGCRGRSSVNAQGTRCGKAPLSIVDLKAGVRFLRAHRGEIPGDTDRIVSVGISAGGAMSTLLGSTGNSEAYTEELQKIGAVMTEPDDIFAAQCYCPIIDLDHADYAYEWMFEGRRHYDGMPFVGFTAGELTPYCAALSDRMGQVYADYFNGFGLTHPVTGEPLALAPGRGGSGAEFLKEKLEQSAAKFLRKLEAGELPEAKFIRVAEAGEAGEAECAGELEPDGAAEPESAGKTKPGEAGEPECAEKPGSDGAGEPESTGKTKSGEAVKPEYAEKPGPDGAGEPESAGKTKTDGASKLQTGGSAERKCAGKPAADSQGRADAENYIHGNYLAQKFDFASHSMVNVPGIDKSGWLSWDGGKAKIASLDAMQQNYHTRLKLCPAFDDLNLIQAENQEFGTAQCDKVHFDAGLAGIMESLRQEFPKETERYLPGYREAAADETLAARRYQLNPMNYIGTKEKTTLAPHFRIRVGSRDADTSLTVTMLLALRLLQTGRTDVDYEIVWDEPHGRADYPGEVTAWVNRLCGQCR